MCKILILTDIRPMGYKLSCFSNIWSRYVKYPFFSTRGGWGSKLYHLVHVVVDCPLSSNPAKIIP